MKYKITLDSYNTTVTSRGLFLFEYAPKGAFFIAIVVKAWYNVDIPDSSGGGFHGSADPCRHI